MEAQSKEISTKESCYFLTGDVEIKVFLKLLT